MTQTADYTYDREADCFVVTDSAGNELCRTSSPHRSWHRTLASSIASMVNDEALIFPTSGDTQTDNVR